MLKQGGSCPSAPCKNKYQTTNASLYPWKHTNNICQLFTKGIIFIPHLLTSVTRAENGFSQAYILMILMPDTTSFMMRILLSVWSAVLVLQKIKNEHIIQLHIRQDMSMYQIIKMKRNFFKKTHIENGHNPINVLLEKTLY